jgi:hypothetical protein
MVNSRPHMPKTPSAPPRGRRSRATAPGRDPDPDPNGDNPTRTKSARAAFLMAGLELRPFRRAAPRFDLCATSIDREGGGRNFAYQILGARWRDGEMVAAQTSFLFSSKWARLGRRRNALGPNARNCRHSSPAGGATIGPNALDRRTSTTCSSVRSHRFIRWQPDVPRRHHCRPAARLRGRREALRGQLGPASLAVGGRSEQLADVRSPQA